MASSNQADDAILPIAQPPLPQEQRPTTPLAATHPTLDNPVEKKRMEYLKVMDMRIDTAEIITVFYDTSCNWNTGITLPKQPDKTIRIVFDGRDYARSFERCNEREYDQCLLLKDYWRQRYNPKPLDLRRTDAEADNLHLLKYHQPILRRIWQQSPCPGWYTSQIHGVHADKCKHLLREDWALERDRFEKSLVSFTSFKDAEGNQIFCLFAPDCSYSDDDCLSIAWRWLRAIETALCTKDKPRPIDGTLETALQFVLFRVLSATLTFNARFLDQFLINTYLPHLKKPRWHPPSLKPVAVRSSIITLRNIQESIAFFSATLEDLTESMRKKLGGTGSDHQEAFFLHLDNIMQDCKFYQLKVSQSITNQTEAFEVLNYGTYEKQASSVQQLSLLAAFFLPLSLAAGVLSIQTRFVDLKLLLYDFVGVVLVFGSLAALLFVVNRYGSSVFDSTFYLLYRIPNRWSTPAADAQICKIYKLTLISSWWVALLVSFLTGMLKDVNLALKILKFEAMGIASVVFLSILIIVFCQNSFSLVMFIFAWQIKLLGRRQKIQNSK